MSMFESCLFLLAVAKAVQLTCPVGEGRAPSLFSLLLRDSILYFGGVLSVILTNLIVWIVGRVRVHIKLSHLQQIEKVGILA